MKTQYTRWVRSFELGHLSLRYFAGKSFNAIVMVNDVGSNPKINNSIFWKNFPIPGGNVEIQNNGNAQPQFKNSMLETYNPGSTGNNLVNVDPRFVSVLLPIGADNTWLTADDGLRLDGCSPAVNSGDNTLVTQATDITGQLRIVGNTVDRGAYELQLQNPAQGKIIYVNAAATGANDGSSWTNAYTSLQVALKQPCFDTIKIAAGIYKPAVYSRDSSFVISRNIVIQGSYDIASGIADVEAHPTVLSGNIGNLNDSTDNS